MNNSKNTLPLSHPAKLICTWFGSGLLPKAPGTAGSLAALPFAYIIHSIGGNDALLIASLIAFVIGWKATQYYLNYTDSKDPKEVVIDEVAGQWFLLSFLPPTWIAYVFGFLLFRFFDVLKPWPISWVDRKVKGAMGVMLDDMLAAFLPFIVVGLLIILGQLNGTPIKFTGFMEFLAGQHVQ